MESNFFIHRKHDLLKRLASLSVLLSICLGTYATTFNSGGLVYNILSDNTVEVYGLVSISTKSVSIPTTVTYNSVTYSVVGIHDYAFRTQGTSIYGSGNGSLTSLIIPSSVTSIGIGITSYCTALTTIQVDTANPNYYSTDGEYLYNCVIEKSTKSIVAGCKNSTCPTNNILEIGDYAFYRIPVGRSGLTSSIKK